MKAFSLFLCALCLSVSSFSQILISSTANDTLRDKSAVFELKSNTQGFLPPRMSTADRKAMQNPAPGLMVFDTTKQLFYGFTKGLGWRPFSMGFDTAFLSDPQSPTVPGLLLDDNFGESVAIWGDLAVAGARGTTVNGKTGQGALYLFHKNGTQWENTQKITAPDGEAGDFFGWEVSMTDKYVVVSALSDDVGENLNQGSVYVYKIQNDTLIYSQKLTSQLAAANDYFGGVVKITQNHLFIAATSDDIGANTDQGSAYYFALENGNWVEKQKIIQDSGAAAWDYFGHGFSVTGNWVSIGHSIRTDSDYGLSGNSVFLYELVGNSWVRRQKIMQPDDLSGRRDGFGYSAQLTDSTLTVGAWLKDEPVGNKDRGAAYLFKKNGTSWGFVKKFSPADVNIGDYYGDYFGYIIRASGKYLLLGDGYEDIASGIVDHGACYLYEWNGNEWIVKRKIALPEPSTHNLFGHALDIQGDNLIISASEENGGRGQLYFYSLLD